MDWKTSKLPIVIPGVCVREERVNGELKTLYLTTSTVSYRIDPYVCELRVCVPPDQVRPEEESCQATS